MTNDYGNLELHKVLLKAMKEIDKICRENNLKYYLHAGTLLGAVNHKGFIPWDDDVDLTLMRSDFDKLVEIIENEYSDWYYIQTYRNDVNYNNNRAKLRIKGTQLIDKINGEQEKEEIFVDLAPLYFPPKSKIMQLFQKKIIEIIDAIVLIQVGENIPTSVVSKYILYPLSKINRRFWGNLMDFLMVHMQNKNSGLLGTLCYVGFNPYTGLDGYYNDMISLECYEHEEYLPFEDTEFMTISHWHEDLLRRYGKDYMKPYPEEKRVTKHNIASYKISDVVRKRVGL